MYEQIQPILQDFMITLITGVLAILSGFLVALAKKGVNWVSAKIDAVKDENIRERALDAVDKLETIVNTTVISLQQTLGDDIKTSILNNDGKYTREDLLALKDKAVSDVEHQLTSSTVELLGTIYPDVHKMIEDLVEMSVRNLKFLTDTTIVSEVCTTTEESSAKKILNE